MDPSDDSRAAAPRETARREVGRFLKFLAVGAFGFLIDTGSLSVFVFVLSLNRVLAKGLAFSLAVICNFILNRLWTYPDSRSKSLLAQSAQFALVSLVGLGINLVIFGWVDAFAMRFVSAFYALYIAQAAAVGVALFWNYAANRVVTYGDVAIGR
jgi:putative flippase GtrA